MSVGQSSTAPSSAGDSVSTDIALRTGGELTAVDLDSLAREYPATLIVLVGPPEAGKTTLIVTLYEWFRQAKVAKFAFSGSHSLMAFERRCHLSRMASKLARPETERTPAADEELFYHLRVARLDDLACKDDLFLLDVAGEQYRELRTSDEACLSIESLGRADYLVLLIDGETLKKAQSRYLTLEQAINFLQCVADSRALAAECRLQIVITKADKIVSLDRSRILKEVESTIEARIGNRFPRREFALVAVRPDNPKILPTGFGLNELFARWLNSAIESVTSETTSIAKAGERESEAFAHRNPAEPPR